MGPPISLLIPAGLSGFGHFPPHVTHLGKFVAKSVKQDWRALHLTLPQVALSVIKKKKEINEKRQLERMYNSKMAS